jgi:hypothetical protein
MKELEATVRIYKLGKGRLAEIELPAPADAEVIPVEGYAEKGTSLMAWVTRELKSMLGWK